MSKIIKNIMFLGAICVMAAPLLLHYNLKKEDIIPLRGAYEKTDTVALSIGSFIDKSWQSNQEEIYKNNLIIKPTVVRIAHEMDYHMFGVYHMNDLVVGKEDSCLVEVGLIPGAVKMV